MTRYSNKLHGSKDTFYYIFCNKCMPNKNMYLLQYLLYSALFIIIYYLVIYMLSSFLTFQACLPHIITELFQYLWMSNSLVYGIFLIYCRLSKHNVKVSDLNIISLQGNISHVYVGIISTCTSISYCVPMLLTNVLQVILSQNLCFRHEEIQNNVLVNYLKTEHSFF